MNRLLFATLVFMLISPALAYPDGDQRAIILKGTRNTRDLGGLPTANGHVRKGKLLRSGALCFASRADASKLHGLGIQTLLELRLPIEIQTDGADKSYLTERIPRTIHWPMGNSHGIGREAYVSYLNENEELFRDFFHLLAEPGSYPVLYHCSAGKDRTGILTALLLEHLGTPRKVIIDDYIHSRRITPKLKVQEDWIQVVFDRIDKVGGIGNYLTRIGVTPKQQNAVKRNLVISG